MQYFDDEQSAQFHVQTIQYGGQGSVLTGTNSKGTNLRDDSGSDHGGNQMMMKNSLPTVDYNPQGYSIVAQSNAVTANLISDRELE